MFFQMTWFSYIVVREILYLGLWKFNPGYKKNLENFRDGDSFSKINMPKSAYMYIYIQIDENMYLSLI